ncbi:hypothetical protein WH87_04195 [Devosia epidermidihirudinis]|uniref:Uncharacterized protein n=1 Tax=Devosia epidermidihirudinis TaxID=1293439 RepID=A0A0F5QEJ9_9HYPH|nr:hypothetical protein [Devosia epidermidihirudinis]KKC39422.1 hypothetical protein WH87_04195 [Devosia epidermidihirudinis]
MNVYGNNPNRTGVEFIEGFALLAGALWIGGALIFGTVAYLGSHKAGAASAASNQTSIGESNNTPATEGLENAPPTDTTTPTAQ